MSDSVVGVTVDARYQVRRLIARGGMGIVLEATHRYTRRSVVIKVLADELRRSKEAQGRLLREALALTTIRHPGVVEVLDAGVCATYGPYVALEMLDGRSLDGILAARQRLTVADSVQVMRQVCDAVAHAHSRGVVHRDLKPSNFFIARNEIAQETVKLIDLGVAAVAAEQLNTGEHKLTQMHEVLGTPEYMAPEQLTGRPVDARTDVYAIGVSMFECLTGEVPFAGSYPEVLMKVMSSTSPPKVREKRPEIPAALAVAIERAIRKEAAERFQSAADLGAAIVAASGLAPAPSELLSTPTTNVKEAIEEAHETAGPIELVRKKAAAPVSALASTKRDTGAHRRQHPRAPYVTPAVLVTLDGKETEARSEEISVGGMLVLSPTLFSPGAALRVRFATPVTGEMIELQALVRWTREGRGRWALGLEFAHAPSALRRVLSEFVQLFQTIPPGPA